MSYTSRFVSGFYAQQLKKIDTEFHEIYKESVLKWARHYKLPINYLADYPAHVLVNDIAILETKIDKLEKKTLELNKNNTWDIKLEYALINFKNQRQRIVKELEVYTQNKKSCIKGRPLRGGWRDRLIKSRKFEEQIKVEDTLAETGEGEEGGTLQPETERP